MSDLRIAINFSTIFEASVVAHIANTEPGYHRVRCVWTSATVNRAVVANNRAIYVSSGQFGRLALGNWSWSSKSYNREEKSGNG